MHAGRHRVVAHGEGGGEPVRRHLPRRHVVHVEAAVLVVSATASSASAAATEAVVRPDAVVVLARDLGLHPKMSILGRFGSFLGQCRDFISSSYPDKGGGGRGGTISFAFGTQETSSSSSIILSFFTEAKELTRSDIAATNAFSFDFDPFGPELSKAFCVLSDFAQGVLHLCLPGDNT